MVRRINYTEDTESIPNGIKIFVDPNVQYSTDIFHDVLHSNSNSSLAMKLSGSTDRKSSSYKAALRRVEIWKQKGKEPGKPTKTSQGYRGKIMDLARKENLITNTDRSNTINSLRGSYRITIKGTKKISNDITDRDFYLTMSEENFRDFLRTSLENGQDASIDFYTQEGISSDGRHYPSFTLFKSSNTGIQIERA